MSFCGLFGTDSKSDATDNKSNASGETIDEEQPEDEQQHEEKDDPKEEDTEEADRTDGITAEQTDEPKGRSHEGENESIRKTENDSKVSSRTKKQGLRFLRRLFCRQLKKREKKAKRNTKKNASEVVSEAVTPTDVQKLAKIAVEAAQKAEEKKQADEQEGGSSTDKK